MTSTRVVVVGAGPYGLAVGAHLRSRGVPFRIFGSTMSTWIRQMPNGMFLKSEGHASSISDPADRFTLARFCAETGREYGDIGVPVAIDTFVEYGRWFQNEAVPELEEVDVAAVTRNGGDGFTVELGSGERLHASTVVLATGVGPYAYVPSALEPLQDDRVTHTSDHASFEAFAGQEVAVLGGGQSALETAALLAEAGAVPRVVVRGPRLYWNSPPVTGNHSLRVRVREPQAPLGNGWKLWGFSNLAGGFRHLPENTRFRLARETLGPAGAWWLRPRFEPAVPVQTSHVLVGASAEGDRVRMTFRHDGSDSHVTADHAIAGTGFRVRLDRLRFLDDGLRAQIATRKGAPHLSRHFESTSVRGLYFVGLPAAPTFGPLMRFVCGSRFAAARVTAHVA